MFIIKYIPVTDSSDKKKYLPQTTIISILISGDKMVICLSHKDQTIWLVYIIIENLNIKILQSQKREERYFWTLSQLFMIN